MYGGRDAAALEGPHIINIFSFSKAFGMMGWARGLHIRGTPTGTPGAGGSFGESTGHHPRVRKPHRADARHCRPQGRQRRGAGGA